MNFIDKTIIINTKVLPKQITEIIENLEKYNETNDDCNYSIELENLEPVIKALILNGKLEKEYYNLLMKKYGGYV